MALSISRQFLRVGATALVLTTAITASVIISADAAYAERGAHGNSNGNRGNSNGSQGNEISVNRGAIASELKNLNAAHASQTGLENANADSLIGLLFAYQTEQRALAEAGAGAEGEVTEVAAGTEEETPLQVIEEGALAVLTGGRELTESALGELNRLLGLN